MGLSFVATAEAPRAFEARIHLGASLPAPILSVGAPSLRLRSGRAVRERLPVLRLHNGVCDSAAQVRNNVYGTTTLTAAVFLLSWPEVSTDVAE
jgi:hypothetical protein